MTFLTFCTGVQAESPSTLRVNELRGVDKRRPSMYYRVAIQADPSPTWQWKSTTLSELSALFQFLRFYRPLGHDCLRVFYSSSREVLNEQLERENHRQASTSVTAVQFLQERMISSSEISCRTSTRGTHVNKRSTSIAVVTGPSPKESNRGVNARDGKETSHPDKRREELERGVGGDHDILYRFALPASMPQVLAWINLLVRVQDGTLQP
jgi:hypothetical protein